MGRRENVNCLIVLLVIISGLREGGLRLREVRQSEFLIEKYYLKFLSCSQLGYLLPALQSRLQREMKKSLVSIFPMAAQFQVRT